MNFLFIICLLTVNIRITICLSKLYREEYTELFEEQGYSLDEITHKEKDPGEDYISWDLD